MDCTPVKLIIDETLPKPPKVTTVRSVPLHWHSAGERILTDLLQTGIVQRVTEPVPCVSPSFFVKKGDGLGDPRLVLDYKETLNKLLIRVPHPLPSPMNVWAKVKPGSTHFIACDLKAAFWQLPLSEESQGLTSFMSSFGILCWKRLPMGISVAPDTFNRELDIAFSKNPKLKNIVREVDDVLIYASSQEELEEQFCELLKTCRGARITLAPKKTYFAGHGENLRYAGMKISSEGAQMSNEHADKLRAYPEPTNRKELAAWVGLAAQCNAWFPEINQASYNMRQLLKKDREFVWTETMSQEFKDMCQVLCSKITLSSFNQSYETKLLVDSSIKYGVAYVLLQVSPEGKVTVIRCGSCSVPRSWHSLSAIEVECAGILWATNHCRFYLRGAPMFTIVTDHLPLVKVLTGSMENLSPKLFRCVTDMLEFNYKVIWTPGKSHMFVDSLGQIPQLESFKDWDPLSNGEETDWENGGQFGFHQSANNVTHLDQQVGLQITQTVMVAVGEDALYQRVLQEVGVRSKRGLRELPRDHPAQALKQVWDSLGKIKMPNGEEMMILDSRRLFIPAGAREEVLETLHIAHLGVAKMCSAARNLFYWPHLRRDIERVVQGCEACQVYSPSKPCEEMMQHGTFPTRAMSQLCFDIFFYKGSQYLHIMDLYSSFIFTRKMKATPSTEVVIKTLEAIFEAYGFPELLYSDSGPQM